MGYLEEECLRTLADCFDVIGLRIADVPTTRRFGRTDDVCHDRFDSMPA